VVLSCVWICKTADRHFNVFQKFIKHIMICHVRPFATMLGANMNPVLPRVRPANSVGLPATDITKQDCPTTHKFTADDTTDRIIDLKMSTLHLETFVDKYFQCAVRQLSVSTALHRKTQNTNV